MAIDALSAYALSKSYTDETVIGGGAIKGKNCVIDSIEDITEGHRVTFSWTLDDGTEKTSTMDVLDGQEGPQGSDGADGVGIASITFKETDLQGNNVYTITLTNGDSDDITCPRGPQGSTEYSTSEQIIGTWIDGKPVYRLVVPYESSASVGKSYLISTITAGLNVVTLDGIVEESNSVVNIDNYNCRILYNNSNGTLTFQGATSWGKIKGQVIMTYTKPVEE